MCRYHALFIYSLTTDELEVYYFALQLTTKSDSIQCLEGQLSECRKRFSTAQEEISRLEENVREINLELSTSRTQQERLEHSVSSLTLYF